MDNAEHGVFKSKLTDLIVQFLVPSHRKDEALNLRKVSLTFEHAVLNTAMPRHSVKLAVGVEQDKLLQSVVAMRSCRVSRVNGLPLTLKLWCPPTCEQFYSVLKALAPNVIKIIIMDSGLDIAFDPSALSEIKFPKLRYLRVYTPPNHLYYAHSHSAALVVQTLFKHNGKQLRDFELSNNTNRGAIQFGSGRVPPEITSIRGTFHEFPAAYLEVALEVSRLVNFNIECYVPVSNTIAENAIQPVVDKFRDSLRVFVLECQYLPTIIQLQYTGTYTIEKLILTNAEICLPEGALGFGTTFPNLLLLDVYRITGNTNQALSSERIPSNLSNITVRNFPAFDEHGKTSLANPSPRFFASFPFLKNVSIGFPNFKTTQVALQELFQTSKSIEVLEIRCSKTQADQPDVDFNYLLTNVTTTESFKGRITWSSLRQRENSSVANLNDLRELSLRFDGFRGEITSFFLDSLSSLKFFKLLKLEGQIYVPNALKEWFESSGRSAHLSWTPCW